MRIIHRKKIRLNKAEWLTNKCDSLYRKLDRVSMISDRIKRMEKEYAKKRVS